MYYFYFNKLLLPIPPQKLQTKISNKNKTINLINDGEINLQKVPGLTEFSFDILLPNVKYPFATYKNGFKNAKYFLNNFEKLKVNQKTFQFIVSRALPNGKVLYDTNIKVTLEDYSITEDAKDGFDSTVNIKLKKYKDYSTKKIKIKKKNKKVVAVKKKTRPAPTKKSNNSNNKSNIKTYTVKKGDCLWNIAKRFYGSGSQYKKIYNANKDKIKNPNLIYPKQVLIIP